MNTKPFSDLAADLNWRVTKTTVNKRKGILTYYWKHLVSGKKRKTQIPSNGPIHNSL